MKKRPVRNIKTGKKPADHDVPKLLKNRVEFKLKLPPTIIKLRLVFSHKSLLATAKILLHHKLYNRTQPLTTPLD